MPLRDWLAAWWAVIVRKLCPLVPDRGLIPFGLSHSRSGARITGFQIRLPLLPYYSRKFYEISMDDFRRGWRLGNLFLKWTLVSTTARS